jgi:malonyl-CoA decarboxylase
LVFVHVALVPEIARSMAYIHEHSGFEDVNHHHDAKEFDLMEHELKLNQLTKEREHETSKAAIFYSINSTQPGLRGVELGNYLIKRVAQTLTRELPNINQFCTLSPIPGLMRWLNQVAASETMVDLVSKDLASMLLNNNNGIKKDSGEDDVQVVNKILNESLGVGEGMSSSNLLSLVHLAELVNNHPHVIKEFVSDTNKQGRDSLHRVFTQLATYYITKVKSSGHNKAHGNEEEGGSRRLPPALDPVTNFHLRNGAMLYRVNFGGDVSVKGLQASGSVMANYLYDLKHIELLSERYEDAGVITTWDEFSR